MLARILALFLCVAETPNTSQNPVPVSVVGPVDMADGGNLTPIIVHEQLLADGGYPFTPHGVVDVNNTSTTPLGANATFTGGWSSVKDYGAIILSVQSDQNSAINGLVFEWSPDGVNADVFESGFFTANRGRGFAIGPRSQYFRVRFINGSNAQGFFRLMTVLAWPSVQPVIRTLDRDLTSENLAQSTRSVIAAQTGFDAGVQIATYTNVEGSTTIPGQSATGLVTRPIGPVEVVLDGGVIATVGPVTNSQLRASPINVFVDGGSIITIQGTSPWAVSGPLTDAQLRASPHNVFVDGGSITALQGTSPWAVSGPLTNSELRASPINAFVDGGTVVATQGGIWTVQQGAAPWTVSLGTVDSKTNVLKTGTLVTTATTADQVVLTYTVTSGKTFFVQYVDFYARLTTPGGGNLFFGNISLESPAGTKLYTADLVSPATGVERVIFAEPIPIAASTVIRIVCTPGATTSYTWRANAGGFER